MKLRFLISIFFVMFSISSEANFSGNTIEKINYRNLEHIKVRDMEEINQYDSYMILYFRKDCKYTKDFKNNYRKNINFIINRENGNKLTSEETLIIHKGFGIEIHFNSSVKDLQYFFDRFSDNNIIYLESIDLDNFDSSLVTNMEMMFYECLYLKSISLSNIDTSNVILMDYIFYGCSSLESIDLSNFNTSSVIDMSHMFHGCNSLKSINLSNFNTSSVINMNFMFYECNSLKSINLSNFNTSSVINMSWMFYECNSLKSIDFKF